MCSYRDIHHHSHLMFQSLQLSLLLVDNLCLVLNLSQSLLVLLTLSVDSFSQSTNLVLSFAKYLILQQSQVLLASHVH